MDVHIGDFIVEPRTTQKNSEVFWVAKVKKLHNMAKEDGEFLAL